MIPMRFLTWILGAIFTLGLFDSFGRLTYRMARAAVHAHQLDQIPYIRYTNLLWDKKTSKHRGNHHSSK